MAEKKIIQEKRAQMKTTAILTQGQLEMFLKYPSSVRLIALQKNLFAYIEHFGELLEVSEGPEDIDLSRR